MLLTYDDMAILCLKGGSDKGRNSNQQTGDLEKSVNMGMVDTYLWGCGFVRTQCVGDALDE